jgi:predicted ABC-type ATPase
VPLLHLVIGPHGAGKTTFFERVLSPITHLPCINAEVLARQRWPGEEEAHGREAAALAQSARRQALAQGLSFVGETVFSHPSTLTLLRDARDLGYLVQLHIILVPEALSVARVALCAAQGDHRAPEHKVRERHQRLWPLVTPALALVPSARVYDNSSARHPFRVVATYEQGRMIGPEDLPAWSPWPGLNAP